jgi:hypothetical protein
VRRRLPRGPGRRPRAVRRAPAGARARAALRGGQGPWPRGPDRLSGRRRPRGTSSTGPALRARPRLRSLHTRSNATARSLGPPRKKGSGPRGFRGGKTTTAGGLAPRVGQGPGRVGSSPRRPDRCFRARSSSRSGGHPSRLSSWVDQLSSGLAPGQVRGQELSGPRASGFLTLVTTGLGQRSRMVSNRVPDLASGF